MCGISVSNRVSALNFNPPFSMRSLGLSYHVWMIRIHLKLTAVLEQLRLMTRFPFLDWVHDTIGMKVFHSNMMDGQVIIYWPRH
jgi:hypothetical protein